MPFWKKAQVAEAVPPTVVEAHRLSEALARLEGSLSCSERTCEASSGVACQYVDRRNRTCKTAWCPQHRIVMDGQVLCRRHAGVVSALPRDTHSSAPLPDLENRAPSMVSWVARELDADIRSLLLQEISTTEGGQLVADPLYLIFLGADRIRAWERAWKLVTHTGTAFRVSLCVEEDADTEVCVKVGSNVLDRAVPPWIVDRPGSEGFAEGDDQRLRGEFNARLLEVIKQGMGNERQFASDARAEEGQVKRIYHG